MYILERHFGRKADFLGRYQTPLVPCPTLPHQPQKCTMGDGSQWVDASPSHISVKKFREAICMFLRCGIEPQLPTEVIFFT